MPTPPKNKQDATKADVKKSSTVNKTPAISSLANINSGTTPAMTALKSIKTTTVTKSNNSKATKIPQTTTNTVIKPTAVIAPNKKCLTYPGNIATQVSTARKPTLNVNQKVHIKEQLKNNCDVEINNGDNVTKPFINRLNNATKFARPQPVKLAGILPKKPLAHPRMIGTNTKLPKAGTTVGNSGAIGKAHLLQSKRFTAESNERGNIQRNAKLATSFKAKKTQVSTLNRPTAHNKITIKGKTLLNGIRTCTTDTAFAIAETPTDLLNINPFEPFVTSTRVKSLSPHSANAPCISPVNSEMVINNNKKEKASNQNIRLHSSSSAKRTLLPNAAKQLPQNQMHSQNCKFNFVRYSVGLSELESDSDTGDVENGMKEIISSNQMEQTTVLEAEPNDSNNEGKYMNMIKETF